MSGQELVEALAECRQNQTGHRQYPKSLRQTVGEYYRAECRRGRTRGDVASELGVCASTLDSWRPPKTNKLATVQRFRAVEIQAPVRLPSPLTVHGPRGLRIEGLDIESLAELLSRVG